MGILRRAVSGEKHMIEIVSLGDATTDDVRANIERIFFASAGRTTFADEAERSAFRERWLGRYLIHDRAHAFLARASESGAVVGYLVGCLDDPARANRFSDIGYYEQFADLTVRYPAHLHINLDPAWRSKGIGGGLVEAFADHAARHGALGVHVVTGAAARNVGFYQRCGFAPLREADWNGNAILIMARRLTPARAP
jgi:GNAT superfamily N-acetyltransferase